MEEAAITVSVGMEVAPDINSWMTPAFEPAFKAALAELAAAGTTNTAHVAYVLR
jgi:hypothetical protein